MSTARGGKEMKVAYITPRYGPEVIGGAENAVRMLAEALVEHEGASVEVLTTTALSMATWGNHYEAGASSINGVTVRRFPVDKTRAPDFLRQSQRHLLTPFGRTRDESLEYLKLQGPVSEGVLEAVIGSSHDVICFYPYLYHPIVHGILSSPGPSVLHPAAHDEPALDLPIMAEAFARVDGLAYQTAAERQVVESRFPVAQKPSIDLGMGFRAFGGAVSDVRAKFGLGEDPFLLCLGRVDVPKGSTLLVELFSAYSQRNSSSLRLVFAGPVATALPDAGGVIVTGEVSEQDKWGLLQECLALVSPSPLESFAIVLLESWSCAKPVLVNADCEATHEQVMQSGGGLAFDGFESFEAAVKRLVADARAARSMGLAGRAYTRGRYQWPNLISRYRAFLESVISLRTSREPG